ncbi:MAG: hypothetical protein ACI9H8_002574 [Lysobacterales bacterium]|jgi:hypothetical protein
MNVPHFEGPECLIIGGSPIGGGRGVLFSAREFITPELCKVIIESKENPGNEIPADWFSACAASIHSN